MNAKEEAQSLFDNLSKRFPGLKGVSVFSEIDGKTAIGKSISVLDISNVIDKNRARIKNNG